MKLFLVMTNVWNIEVEGECHPNIIHLDNYLNKYNKCENALLRGIDPERNKNTKSKY